MGKAQFHIRADLFNVLLWVIRDQPAAMGLIGYCCRFALHLASIVDLNLILSRQSQRGPDPCILQRPISIGIKRDLDLYHFFDRLRIASGSLGTFGNGWQQLVAVERIAFARSADKTISRTSDKFCRNGTASAYIDRNRLDGFIVDCRIARMVMLAITRYQF